MSESNSLINTWMKFIKGSGVLDRLGGYPVYTFTQELIYPVGKRPQSIRWSYTKDREKRDKEGLVRSYLSSEYKKIVGGWE